MAGIQNKVLYGEGVKITPTDAQSLFNMQQASTDVARINYTGNPNGVISANPGSLCHDPVSGIVYRKSTGTSNTGWVTIGTDITLTGNSGGAIAAVSNNFNLLTANSTVQFVGTAGTQTIDFGLANLLLGNNGSTITIGTNNTGVGRGLFGSLTSGTSNTFYGINLAGPMLLSTGSQNCGFGVNALAQISSGSNNYAFGYLAGTQYTGSDSGNISIGHIGVTGESSTIRIGTPGVGSSQQSKAFMAGITAVTVAGSAPVGVDTNGQLNSLGFGTIGNVLTSNGPATSPTFQSLASLGGITSITGSSGGAQTPSAGNFNILGSGSITSVGTANTETIQLTGLTNHNVLVGAGTATMTKVAPSATAGIPLVSNGSSSDPSFSTALVAGGGTGLTSTTAYGLIAGGTTTTGAFQNTGAGTTGQYLKSNGAAALPSFAALPAQSSNARVSLATTIPNVTGDGTIYAPVLFDTVNFDVGSNYSVGTGLFTAPTTGKYLVCINLTLQNLGAAHTAGELRIIVSGGTITRSSFNPFVGSSGGQFTVTQNIVLSLTAAQTLQVATLISGSTKTVGIAGNSFGDFTTASITFLG